MTNFSDLVGKTMNAENYCHWVIYFTHNRRKIGSFTVWGTKEDALESAQHEAKRNGINHAKIKIKRDGILKNNKFTKRG